MLSEKVKNAFEENNGILTLKEAEELQLSKESLRKAYLRGDIVKGGRGVYLLSDEHFDQMLITQKIFKSGIFSNETAVFLYDYSTWVPKKYHMTFPYGYHSKNFDKYMIKPTFATPKYYELGISKAENWDGNIVITYDRERTVLDIVRSRTVMFDVQSETIESYLYDSKRDIDRLVKYAKLMNMESVVESEVLNYAK